MISLKSQLVKATLAATAAIPLATAAMFASVGSAQAASLSGGFNFTGAGFPATTVTVSNTSLTFSPDPGLASLSLQSGSFTAFNAANINSITTSPLTPNAVFLDLGSYSTQATLTDGNNTFTLTSFNNPTFTSVNGGTDVNESFLGYFNDGLGNITQGQGYITFSTQDNNAQAKYNAGQTFQATFTGLAVTSVPEPSTMLGLGIVGAGMVMSRRRKRVAQ